MKNRLIIKKYFLLLIIISFLINLTGFLENTKIVLAANNNYRPEGKVNISVENQTLSLSGYTFDPDCKWDAAAVHVYIFQDIYNKICIKTFIADSYNSEANKDYNCGYYHGFNQSVTVDKTGTWNLEVYAIDLNSDGSTAGIYNPIIYSGTITFTKEPSISISTNALTVSSDGTQTPYPVDVDTNNTGNYHIISDSDWLKAGRNRNKNSSGTKLLSLENGYFYIFVDQNTSKNNRTGVLMVSHANDSSKKQTIIVTQTAPTPQLIVTPINITADSDGTISPSFINIDTSNTGKCSISSNDNWLTINTNNNKSSSVMKLPSVSSGYLYIFAEKNTSTSDRTGTLEINHTSDNSKKQIVTITQKGCNSEPTLDSNIIPQLTVNPNTVTATFDGTLDQSYINIDTNNTGNYNVFTSDTWLTVGTNSNRNLSKTNLTSIEDKKLYIFASENTEQTTRNATITIVHNKDTAKKVEIKVTQEGKNNIDINSPYLSVEQTKLSVTADGNFTDNNNCIFANTNNTGGFQVSVTANWLKISKDNTTGKEKSLQYTDSGNFYLFVEKNTSEKERESIVTITHEKDKNLNKTVIITQEPQKASVSNINLSVNRDIVNANVNGETDINYIEVKAENTNGFSVETDVSWIHVAKTSDGKKEAKLSFQESNKFYIFVDKTEDSTKREGNITISSNHGDINTHVFIKQAELIPVLTVSSNNISIEKDGTFSEGNEILIDTEDTGGFTAAIKDASWLRLTSNKEASFLDGFATKVYDSSTSIYLTAKENETGQIRTGQILLEHQSGGKSITITVSQSGAKNLIDRTFIVDTDTHDFDSSNKSISSAINITADAELNWTVTSNDSTWLKVSKNNSLSGDSYGSISGSGNAVFYIIAEKNETYEERGEWIKITTPEHESHEIYVTQTKREIFIPCKTVINQIKFSTSKKTFRRNKTSKIKIKYPELPELDIEEIDVKNCVEYIKYKSNKPKIVSVNKKGVIRGKKKGKGKVSVKIKLSDDMGHHIERTVTINVTVGKATINTKIFQKKKQ